MPNFTQPNNWKSSQYLTRLDIIFKLITANGADLSNIKNSSFNLFRNLETYFKFNNVINQEFIKRYLEIDDLDFFLSNIDESTSSPRVVAELINLCCDIEPIKKVYFLKRLLLVLPNSLRIIDYIYHWMNHESIIRSANSKFLKTHSIEKLMRLKYDLLQSRRVTELHYSPFHGVSIGHFCAFINGLCYHIQNKDRNEIKKVVIWTHSEHSIGYKLEKILEKVFPSIEIIDCKTNDWHHMKNNLNAAYDYDQFFDIRYPTDPSYFTEQTIHQIRNTFISALAPSRFISDNNDCAVVHVRTSSFKPDSQRYHIPRNANIDNYSDVANFLYSLGIKSYLYPSGANKSIDNMVTFNTNTVEDQMNQIFQILSSTCAIAAPSGISHLFYLGTDNILFANHTDLLIHTNYISKYSLFCLKKVLVKEQNTLPPTRTIFIDIILQDWTYMEFENYFVAVENSPEELTTSLKDLYCFNDENRISWKYTLSNLCKDLGIKQVLSTERQLSRNSYANLLKIGTKINTL